MYSVAVGCIYDGNNRRPPIVCCSGRWRNATDSVNTDHSDGTNMELWRNGIVTQCVNRPLLSVFAHVLARGEERNDDRNCAWRLHARCTAFDISKHNRLCCIHFRNFLNYGKLNNGLPMIIHSLSLGGGGATVVFRLRWNKICFIFVNVVPHYIIRTLNLRYSSTFA
jgi:hypothetical protein